MSMEKIIKGLEKEILQQRREEQEILNRIAEVTSPEVAGRAAGALDHRKHFYGVECYLSLLQTLETVLRAGVPSDDALDVVQIGWDAKTILSVWRSEA